MKLPLVLATANSDKAREICEILAETTGRALAACALGVDEGDGAAPGDGGAAAFVVEEPTRIAAALDAVAPLADRPEVDETGVTLEENARIKARALADLLGLPALADDTGLEVDALGGAPGVRAARYAGDRATDAENVAKLLDELDGVETSARTARFVTVAMVRWPDGREVARRGEVEGVITTEVRGGGGFGYDPVFAPLDAGGRTFAEMDAAEKHARSHRGRALRALASALAVEDPR